MTDRRIQRTHKLLADSLLKLAQRDGYDAVTIRDITEQANISYSTFFRHYPDKDALFLRIIQTVIDELQSRVGGSQQPQTSGEILFRHVAENVTLYRALLGGLNSSAMVQRVHGMIVAQILRSIAARSPGDVPPEIAANHVAASVLALVKWWLDADMPYPPERMAAFYAALIIRPALGLP